MQSYVTQRAACRPDLIQRQSNRSGAAAVELALLAPFFATLILGITEIGQIQRAQSYVSEAAYAGCVTASLTGSSNSSVISDVKSILTSCKMTAASATITIRVNDVVTDAATAKTNDKITVTVALPVQALAWSGTHCFVSKSSIVSKTVIMLKQG